jgi:hypothetical protein
MSVTTAKQLVWSATMVRDGLVEINIMAAFVLLILLICMGFLCVLTCMCLPGVGEVAIRHPLFLLGTYLHGLLVLM